MRKAISVTLSERNLLWLRGQAARTAKGSVSEVLDRLVGDARASGKADPASIRSVARTIDLPDEDPDLTAADAYIRSLYGASAAQPVLVRERPPAAARRRRRSRG